MKAFSHSVRVDLRRALFSYAFGLQAFLVFLWMTLTAWEELSSESLRQYWDVLNYLNFGSTGISNFSFLFMGISAVGYAWSYAMDVTSGFFINAVRRVGIEVYGLSRCVSICISSFVASCLGMAAFMLLTVAVGVAPFDPANHAIDELFYLGLAAEGRVILYLLFRFTLTGLGGCLGASFGLLASTWFRDTFSSIFVPVLGLYAWNLLTCLAFALLGCQPQRQWMVSILIFSQPFPVKNTESFCWSTVMLAVLTALCCLAFCRQIRKEQCQ